MMPWKMWSPLTPLGSAPVMSKFIAALNLGLIPFAGHASQQGRERDAQRNLDVKI